MPFYLVIQGHHLPLPRGTNPRRLVLELLLMLGMWHLRIPVMRVRARLPRERVQLGQLGIFG